MQTHAHNMGRDERRALLAQPLRSRCGVWQSN
jgi:hypothetical protein